MRRTLSAIAGPFAAVVLVAVAGLLTAGLELAARANPAAASAVLVISLGGGLLVSAVLSATAWLRRRDEEVRERFDRLEGQIESLREEMRDRADGWLHAGNPNEEDA